ncbi:D-ribose pyranase [Paenibacillus piri]|uniref:D-ribose pyranase n=1 Tax=Paenibacillus piri TaxID=2547395 RepID=A0A4R5K9N1_9BACL|nr:D-ribose pyranase [Paenibacillus piri]TDF91138.1 D-ribose pyranase [Paenibacillus piri]
MKRTGILHKELGACLAGIGHYDQLTLVSCLYGIPKEATVIDLALVRGMPKMKAVLEAIHNEIHIEKLTIASEMKIHHEELYRYIDEIFTDTSIEAVPNDSLKQTAALSKCFIRTGENVIFSNIIIQAGYSV